MILDAIWQLHPDIAFGLAECVVVTDQLVVEHDRHRHHVEPSVDRRGHRTDDGMQVVERLVVGGHRRGVRITMALGDGRPQRSRELLDRPVQIAGGVRRGPRDQWPAAEFGQPFLDALGYGLVGVGPVVVPYAEHREVEGAGQPGVRAEQPGVELAGVVGWLTVVRRRDDECGVRLGQPADGAVEGPDRCGTADVGGLLGELAGQRPAGAEIRAVQDR